MGRQSGVSDLNLDDMGHPWPRTPSDFVTAIIRRFGVRTSKVIGWLNHCAENIRLQFERDKAEALRLQRVAMEQRLEAGRRRRVELEAIIERISEYYEKLLMELQEKVARDPMTGLYNLSYLHEQLGNRLRSYDIGPLAALVKFDVTSFKWYNDTPGLGHHVGDEIIKAVAKVLSSVTRHDPNRMNQDIAVRRSGDEFALFMANLRSADEGVSVAERAKRALREFNFTEVLSPEEAAKIISEKPVEIDVGIAFLVLPKSNVIRDLCRQHASRQTMDWLIKADQVMYSAKKTFAEGPEEIFLGISPDGTLEEGTSERDIVINVP